MEVRLATFGDITEMVIFMKGQHAKSVFQHIPFNPALMRKSFREIIRGPHGDVLLAVSRKGTIRGLLMAWHESMTWTHQKVATDIHFVAEQGGDLLLRAFKRWAKSKGCSELCMGTFSEAGRKAREEEIKCKAEEQANALAANELEKRIERLYNRLGLKTAGHTFRMEL